MQMIISMNMGSKLSFLCVSVNTFYYTVDIYLVYIRAYNAPILSSGKVGNIENLKNNIDLFG